MLSLILDLCNESLEWFAFWFVSGWLLIGYVNTMVMRLLLLPCRIDEDPVEMIFRYVVFPLIARFPTVYWMLPPKNASSDERSWFLCFVGLGPLGLLAIPVMIISQARRLHRFVIPHHYKLYKQSRERKQQRQKEARDSQPPLYLM